MKQIPFAKQYYVDTNGIVYNSKNKEIKSFIDSSKYRRIKLVTDTGVRKLLVHRVVAITYIPNPEDYPVVNHKDGDKLNNSVSNLEWVTHSDNVKHAFATGLRTSVGELNNRALLTDAEVVGIYSMLLSGVRNSDIADRYNVSRAAVMNIKCKKTWSHLLRDLPEVPNKGKSKKLSDATVKWVCEQFSKGFGVTAVLDMSTNPLLNENVLSDIKRRRGYRYISDDYVW